MMASHLLRLAVPTQFTAGNFDSCLRPSELLTRPTEHCTDSGGQESTMATGWRELLGPSLGSTYC